MRHARCKCITTNDVAGIAVALLTVSLLLSSCGTGTRAEDDSWDIEGPLLARDAGVWIVDAVPIVVPDDIALNGSPTLGSIVTASGSVDADGRRVAEQVSVETGALPESTLPEVSLTGSIERIDGNLWIVDGREVLVATGTPIRAAEPGGDATVLLQIASIAEITGNQLDDQRIIARDIMLRPETDAAQPNSVEPADTAVPTAVEDQPEQRDPAPPTPSDTDTDTEDADDDGDNDDGDQPNEDDDEDDGETKKKDKPEKPEKPEKPDKDEKDKP